VSTIIIKTCNDGSGISQLVFFKEPVEALLKDFSIRQRVGYD